MSGWASQQFRLAAYWIVSPKKWLPETCETGHVSGNMKNVEKTSLLISKIWHCNVCYSSRLSPHPSCEIEKNRNMHKLNSQGFEKKMPSIPPTLPRPSLVPTCHSKLCLPISAFILALKKATGSLTCQWNTLTRSLASSLWNRQLWFWYKARLFGQWESLGEECDYWIFEFHNFVSILWLCWSFPECINPYCEGDQSTYV